MNNINYNGMIPYWDSFGSINRAAVSPNNTGMSQPISYEPEMAVAVIEGGPLAQGIRGTVTFNNVPGGTEVIAEIFGLPPYKPAQGNHQPVGPHGFHIHEKGSCDPADQNEPFKSAGGHWNPDNQPHGNHAGDFPVLFSNDGYAKMSFFTNRFRVRDIIGKSVIIHESPDDYRTEPAGNSGRRLACGVIVAVSPYRYPCQCFYGGYMQ